MSERDVLELVEWGETNFGSLVTSREIPRRDVMRAVTKGLVRSIGLVELCDGDGWTVEPTRHREGFVLTDAGRAVLAATPSPGATP